MFLSNKKGQSANKILRDGNGSNINFRKIQK